MAYKCMQIENRLTYLFKGKSRSNKYEKLQRNRKVRHKLKLNPESHPEHKQFAGWEW